MKNPPALAALILAVLPFVGGNVWASPDPVGEADEVRAETSENLCFGGLEDGKIIVGEAYLRNPYRQTTRLGCEVDGGAPATMPDLPAPDAAKHRLV